MFLRRFKEKSIRKHLNAAIKMREVNVSSRKIGSVGIILNREEFDDHESFIRLFKEVGIRENKLKFITYITEETDKPNTWDSYFSLGDFGWKAKINNIELEEFVGAGFDALISFYNRDNLALNAATALSNANFKIGLSGKDPRLHDFIIDVKTSNMAVFKVELLKYLKTLNKI